MLLFGALLLLAASRLVAVLSFPTALQDFAADDLLYARSAAAMAEGNWLGPYDEFTLVKSPGFPLFLAGCKVLGVPFRWAREVLWLAAAFAVALALPRMNVGRWTTLGTAALLLWHPGSLPVEATRLVRESVHGQGLLLFVGLWGLRVTARGNKERWTVSLLMGLLVAWLWLLREESPWMIPALLWVVASMAALRRRRGERISSVVVCAVLLLAPIPLGVQAVRTLNERFFGVALVHELDDPAFRSAIGAILRAEEKPLPMGLVRSETLSRLFEVSPALRELQEGIEGPAYRRDWAVDENGDRYSNMLAWAIRNAAARKGYHQSATKARAFYRRLAREIHGACARGAVPCRPRCDSLLPTFRPEDLGPFLRRIGGTAFDVARARLRPGGAGPGFPIRMGSETDIRMMADVAREDIRQDLAPWPRRGALVRGTMDFVAALQPWLLLVAALGGFLLWKRRQGFRLTPAVSFAGLALVFLIARTLVIAFTQTVWIPTAASYLPCVFPLVVILLPFGVEAFVNSYLVGSAGSIVMAMIVIAGLVIGGMRGRSAAESTPSAWPLGQVRRLTHEEVMVQSAGLLPQDDGGDLVLESDPKTRHPWRAVRVRLIRPRIRGTRVVIRFHADRLAPALPMELSLRYAGTDARGHREGVLTEKAPPGPVDVQYRLPEDLDVLDGFEIGIYGPLPVTIRNPRLERESAVQDR